MGFLSWGVMWKKQKKIFEIYTKRKIFFFALKICQSEKFKKCTFNAIGTRISCLDFFFFHTKCPQGNVPENLPQFMTVFGGQNLYFPISSFSFFSLSKRPWAFSGHLFLIMLHDIVGYFVSLKLDLKRFVHFGKKSASIVYVTLGYKMTKRILKHF